MNNFVKTTEQTSHFLQFCKTDREVVPKSEVHYDVKVLMKGNTVALFLISKIYFHIYTAQTAMFY